MAVATDEQYWFGTPTIATLYINGVALNARMYTQPGDGIVLAAEDGTAVFKDMSFAKFPLK